MTPGVRRTTVPGFERIFQGSALLRPTLPYLAVVIAVALAYDGWIFYGRWSETRDAENSQAAKQAQDTRRISEALGGGRLKILDFYATPGTIRSGQKATICYGVNSAENVRLEPPVEQLHPALSYCFQVAPRHATEYRLIVADRAGHTLTQSLLIQVAIAS